MCQMHHHCGENQFRYYDCSLDHELYLKRAIELAYEAKHEGNGGFGAILVDEDGTILLEAKNEVHTSSDCTAHAELMIAREATKLYDKTRLQKMSLYSSCEPCAMCMGAIVWAQIGQVVYAMTEREMLESTDYEVALGIPSAAIVSCATFKPKLIGPFESVQDLARGVFQ